MNCNNYNNSDQCSLNLDCGWCPNPDINDFCFKDYKCMDKQYCYSTNNEVCSFVVLIHNATLIAGFITTFLLIFMTIVNKLLREGLNNENSFSASCIVSIGLFIPLIMSYFFENDYFFYIFITYLSGGLIINLIWFRYR